VGSFGESAGMLPVSHRPSVPDRKGRSCVSRTKFMPATAALALLLPRALRILHLKGWRRDAFMKSCGVFARQSRKAQERKRLNGNGTIYLHKSEGKNFPTSVALTLQGFGLPGKTPVSRSLTPKQIQKVFLGKNVCIKNRLCFAL